MGPLEQMIAKQAYRNNEKLPDNILNAPSLSLGLNFYFEAFFELDSDRPIGMQAGSLPRQSVLNYADRYDLDFEETEDFIYLMRAMDKAHFKKIRAKDG